MLSFENDSYDLVREGDSYFVAYSPSQAAVIFEDQEEGNAAVKRLLAEGARIFESMEEWILYCHTVAVPPRQLEDL